MTAPYVLVVDDNPANLRLAEFLLTTHGTMVRTASDGVEALTAIRQEQPALILLDLQLPGIDGLTLARQLKDDPTTRDICIVAMTAYAMRADAKRAREAGCDGYLSKPLDPATFAKTVADYMRRSDTAS